MRELDLEGPTSPRGPDPGTLVTWSLWAREQGFRQNQRSVC